MTTVSNSYCVDIHSDATKLHNEPTSALHAWTAEQIQKLFPLREFGAPGAKQQPQYIEHEVLTRGWMQDVRAHLQDRRDATESFNTTHARHCVSTHYKWHACPGSDQEEE